MALGAVVAAALTDHSARSKQLTIGGFDVIAQPGASLGYAVDLESVRVTENGPGGVSSMHVEIEDPNLVVPAPADGLELLFVDLVRSGPPIFRGYVQGWSVVPAFGQQGRRYVVDAIGVNAVLDWAVLATDMTFASGFLVFDLQQSAVQAAVANAILNGVPLRAAADPAGFVSSAAFPLGPAQGTGNDTSTALTISAGTTLREAIRAIYATDNSAFSSGLNHAVDVDTNFGLRNYTLLGPGAIPPDRPSDWTDDTATDTVASGNAAEGQEYGVDAAGVYRSVVVTGTGVSVVVSDGTGKPGPSGSLSDPTITTQAQAIQAGKAYLAAQAQGIRGSYRREAWSPTLTIRAGSFATLTDARLGLAATQVRIMSIDKRFLAGSLETWTLSYGGLPRALSRLIRRLTRAVTT